VLRQFTFVLQRVSASVLQKQSIAINDNLDHLRHLCCSHISNNLPLWHWWQYVFHFSPFDIKGKGLNCSPQAPPDFVHSTVIPGKDISFDIYVFFACCNFSKFSSQASCERILWTCALLINHLCSVLDTSASASYYLRFIRSIVTFCSRLIRKFSSQSSFFNLASMLLSNNLLILLQEYFLYTCQSFVVHNQTQHSYTHIFNTDMKIKESLQVSC